MSIVKTQRMAALRCLCLVGVLAIAACGSTDSSLPGPSVAGSVPAGDCYSENLTAEGSSAQKAAFEEAVHDYTQSCKDARISYNATGSGAGIRQFMAGQVDFAGSDSALKATPTDGRIEKDEAAKSCGSPAWNLPMVIGPVAVAYNLDGVDTLVLTPKVVADIFSGKITTWNDRAIAAINAGADLPADPIKVFFRSEESGTTENFTRYLSVAAADHWPAPPAKKWSGMVGEGKEKSAGVASGVASAKGGIGYVEWGYAKDAHLAYAQIDNGAGPVELTGTSAGKAVAAAKQAGTGNDLALSLDYATKAPGVYPIVLVTYEIVCSKNDDPQRAAGIASFLKLFASAEFQQSLEEIGYAPLPPGIRADVASALEALS